MKILRPTRLLLLLTGLLMTFVPATVAVADVPDRPVKVLSFNIHHGAGEDGVLDLERIARVIEDSGADVIGLQEVDRHFSARSEWVDQPAWLAERLDMHVTYGANLDLDPVNPGEPRRQYGTATLSRFPILDSTNTLLPTFPGQEQRGLLEATIMARGIQMTFANTHLTHNNVSERLEQSKAVAGRLEAGGLPAVLVGDLNAPPEAAEIAPITDALVDAWDEAGEGPGYTYDAANPTKRIDYVLHSGELRARSAEVISTLSSDHLPVLALLDLSSSGSGD